mmetsp:Transcript_32867/g.91510  ORF Transcript_32867/g.91510 Transcript_32867/m.91510 type:complete len:299 (-) Transcript_32867:145-1041(-)
MCQPSRLCRPPSRPSRRGSSARLALKSAPATRWSWNMRPRSPWIRTRARRGPLAAHQRKRAGTSSRRFGGRSRDSRAGGRRCRGSGCRRIGRPKRSRSLAPRELWRGRRPRPRRNHREGLPGNLRRLEAQRRRDKPAMSLPPSRTAARGRAHLANSTSTRTMRSSLRISDRFLCTSGMGGGNPSRSAASSSRWSSGRRSLAQLDGDAGGACGSAPFARRIWDPRPSSTGRGRKQWIAIRRKGVGFLGRAGGVSLDEHGSMSVCSPSARSLFSGVPGAGARNAGGHANSRGCGAPRESN